MFTELYYWIYRVLKKIPTNDNPEFNAFLGISFFQCMNVITLIGIANYFFVLNVPKNIVIYSGIFIYVIITVTNYFSIFSKRDEVKKKYEKLETTRRKKGQLLLLLYVLVTIILFIYVLTNLVVAKY